jgi:hypothetical protein
MSLRELSTTEGRLICHDPIEQFQANSGAM